MFQSRTKRRGSRRSSVRSTKGASAARSLRIEGMERRLMLSASMPEVTPQIPQYSIMQGELSFVAAPATLVGTSPQDGGPIILQGDDAHGTSVAGIVGAYPGSGIGVSGNSDGLPPINLTSRYDGALANIGQGVYDFDSSGSTWTNAFDSSGSNAFDSIDGLQPLRMVLTYNSAGLDTEVVAAVARPEQKDFYIEGGSIPISSVLTELKSSPTAASPEKPAESNAGPPTDAHRTAHGMPATANLIPGEWGRASVFETVGGGRNGDDRGVLDTEQAKSHSDQTRSEYALPLFVGGEESPASQAVAPRTRTDQPRQNDQSKAPDRNQETNPANESAATTGRESYSADATTPESHSSKVTSSTAKNSDSAGEPTAMAGPHGAGIGAVAVAMDDVGNVERASDLWRRSRVAAGLVLVLALERVAAFNSREANRKTEDAEAKPAARAKQNRRAMGGLLLDPR